MELTSLCKVELKQLKKNSDIIDLFLFHIVSGLLNVIENVNFVPA